MVEWRAAPGLPSEATVTEAQARDAVAEACPTTRIVSIESTTLGYTSRQWLARTDEGDLLVKFLARDPDPERTRAMIYATRLASEVGVPVVRFRAFLPESRATGTPVVVQEFVAGERASVRATSGRPSTRPSGATSPESSVPSLAGSSGRSRE